MLEVTLKDRKAVPLGTKTEQTSDKPSKGGELSDEEVKAEAERISKGIAKK